MVKSLLVVESPTKMKTLSKYLGKNFVIKATYGHIKDLPKSKLGVDVEKDFAPHFMTVKGNQAGVKKTLEQMLERRPTGAFSPSDRSDHGRV